MNAIEVKGLSKHFSQTKRNKKLGKNLNINQDRKGIICAVDNINFEVDEGEIFGFLGPNGAGKTTTIRMLTGVLTPTEGQIKIFGKNIWKNPLQVKQIMGNVPEEANIYRDLTGMQNLKLIGDLYAIPKNIRSQCIENLLKKFELFEMRNLKAKKYSKGMKQRLLLCMALISEPKILFLDEPASGLDVASARIIKQVIKDYNQKGVTIFLTTHDMSIANELCDRIAIINKGKIVSLNTPENLKNLFQENQAISVAFNKDVEKEVLEKFSSIKEIVKTKIGWTLIVPEINPALMEIIDFTKANRLGIDQLNTLQPNLEDVFLKIIERGVKN